MHSVIIADDEKWIVEGIKAGVNWNKYGFEVIDDAENGQEALGLIQSLHPTLVLTDIKMPVMNGLELIQRGKAVAPDTIFIVLSGHAEFAYAQKAMNYGTYGYCLKPFEIEEIEGILNRIAQQLKSKTVKEPPFLITPMNCMKPYAQGITSKSLNGWMRSECPCPALRHTSRLLSKGSVPPSRSDQPLPWSFR